MSRVAVGRRMRYDPAREQSHHLVPTHMTLFVQPQSGGRYLMATVLDRGPDNYDWVKVQLANGEEAFCYPDTDFTVDVKSLEPGTEIAISTPRPCQKPGSTKWTCNALHANLQPLAFETPKAEQVVVACAASEKRSKPSASVPYSLARYQFIEKVIKEKGLEGKYAKSEAVGYIIDTCMAAGVL